MFDEALMTSRDVEWCLRHLEEAALASAAGPTAEESARSGGKSYVPTEMLFEALCLARKHEWSWECTRESLSVLLELVAFERAEPLCTMVQSFDKFKELLVVKSCERPPWTVGLFTPEQASELTRFVLAHHFAHFAMHKHLAATQRPALAMSVV